MKLIYLLAFLCILISYNSRHSLPLKDRIYEYNYNGSIFNLTLLKDSSYKLSYPPRHGIYRVEEEGYWYIKEDSIVLLDTIFLGDSIRLYHDYDFTIEEFYIENQDFISIIFKDYENLLPLNNVQVSLNDSELIKKTESNGEVKFYLKEFGKDSSSIFPITKIKVKAETWSDEYECTQHRYNKFQITKRFEDRKFLILQHIWYFNKDEIHASLSLSPMKDSTFVLKLKQ